MARVFQGLRWEVCASHQAKDELLALPLALRVQVTKNENLKPKVGTDVGSRKNTLKVR